MRTTSAYKSLSAEDKQFLSEIAKEVAMLVVTSEKMDCLQKQLTEFADKWKAYKTAYEADRRGKWLPSMGKPSNPMGTIWPIVYRNGWRVSEKYDPKNLMQWYPCRDVRTVLGDYALLAVVHDKILPHCPSIAKEIFPKKLTQEIWRNLMTGIGEEGEVGKPLIRHSKIWRSLSNVNKDLKPELEDNLLQKFPRLRQLIKGSQTKREVGQRASGTAGDIKARFKFNKSQAFFDGRDLGLPTGAEIKAVDILKILVKSFGQVVQYNKLDKTVDPNSESASDVLRQKVLAINSALKKHKVPCKIQSKKLSGYFLSHSRGHSQLITFASQKKTLK